MQCTGLIGVGPQHGLDDRGPDAVLARRLVLHGLDGCYHIVRPEEVRSQRLQHAKSRYWRARGWCRLGGPEDGALVRLHGLCIMHRGPLMGRRGAASPAQDAHGLASLGHLERRRVQRSTLAEADGAAVGPPELLLALESRSRRSVAVP